MRCEKLLGAALGAFLFSVSPGLSAELASPRGGTSEVQKKPEQPAIPHPTPSQLPGRVPGKEDPLKWRIDDRAFLTA